MSQPARNQQEPPCPRPLPARLERLALDLHALADLSTLVVAPRYLARALGYELDPTLRGGERAHVVARFLRYDATADQPTLGGEILHAIARDALTGEGYEPTDDDVTELACAIALPSPLVVLLAQHNHAGTHAVMGALRATIPAAMIRARLKNRHA